MTTPTAENTVHESAVLLMHPCDAPYPTTGRSPPIQLPPSPLQSPFITPTTKSPLRHPCATLTPRPPAYFHTPTYSCHPLALRRGGGLSVFECSGLPVFKCSGLSVFERCRRCHQLKLLEAVCDVPRGGDGGALEAFRHSHSVTFVRFGHIRSDIPDTARASQLLGNH
eukprot:1180803-Prorocentrum_minimum.AAC.1